MLTIYIKCVSIVKTRGMSSVLVVCVFFTYVRLCPRVPTSGGKARVTREDVAHLYCLARLCEDGY